MALKKVKLFWIDSQCKEIETCLNKNNSKTAYQLVKNLLSEKKGESSINHGKSGIVLQKSKRFSADRRIMIIAMRFMGHNNESYGDNTILHCTPQPEYL